mmetsp:Transcript_63634/g.186151  ORF Transcript_63634/g.186151 Transcript_63634/m.186151 type:complete len:201 (-) Transcript_63634:450-1052(-)
MMKSTGAVTCAAIFFRDSVSVTSTSGMTCFTPTASNSGVGFRHVAMASAPKATSSVAMQRPRPLLAPTRTTRLPLKAAASYTVEMSRNRSFLSSVAFATRACWSAILKTRSFLAGALAFALAFGFSDFAGSSDFSGSSAVFSAFSLGFADFSFAFAFALTGFSDFSGFSVFSVFFASTGAAFSALDFKRSVPSHRSSASP